MFQIKWLWCFLFVLSFNHCICSQTIVHLEKSSHSPLVPPSDSDIAHLWNKQKVHHYLAIPALFDFPATGCSRLLLLCSTVYPPQTISSCWCNDRPMQEDMSQSSAMSIQLISCSSDVVARSLYSSLTFQVFEVYKLQLYKHQLAFLLKCKQYFFVF